MEFFKIMKNQKIGLGATIIVADSLVEALNILECAGGDSYRALSRCGDTAALKNKNALVGRYLVGALAGTRIERLTPRRLAEYSA